MFRHYAVAAAAAATLLPVAAQAAFVDLSTYANSDIRSYSGGGGYPTASTTTIGGIDFRLVTNGTQTGIVQLDSLNSANIAAPFTGVDTAYVIINSAFGQSGRTSGSITFTGGGAGVPISLVQGVNIRDHYQGSNNNAASGIFATANYSGGGRFDVYRYDLRALGGTLSSIQFACSTNPCNRDNGLPFLAAVTLLQENAVPEPAAWAMMLAGFGMVGAGLRARRRAVTFA